MSISRRGSGRPLVVGLIAALTISILPGSRVQPALAVSPNVVISQIYGGGGNTGATLTNDFIELFNRGTSPVSLDGWSVQYASAAGTGNFTATPLTGSLAPGQYFLVQEASGAGGTTPLPSPDATGSIAMSATAGKVIVANVATALACNGGSTPCSAAQLAQIVDLIGYGITANFFEGSAAPAPSNTNADARAGAGCTDTDQNSIDFSIALPLPRNSGSTLNPCPVDQGPSVVSTSPTNGTTGVSTGRNVEITFSEPVVVAGSWFSISCTTTGTHSAGVSGGPTIYVLDPVADFGAMETCSVTVMSSQVSDVDIVDPPNNLASDLVFSFTTMNACGAAATAIHDVQGSGLVTPIPGQDVEIQGVVVGDFQASSSFNGFHVQEEDADADADASTSEGVFVFEGGSAVAVAAGDTVRVAGEVIEFTTSGVTLTQLSNVTGVVVCSSGASVTPLGLTLPFATSTFAERYEGMLVGTTQDLTVSETFTLGRFGELVLSSGGRLLNPTNVVEPGAPAQAMQAANNLNRIVLDDGDNTQNLDPTLYPTGGLSAGNTLRVGDTVEPGRFVLEQRFGLYRLQPVDAVAIDATNPRPAAPAEVGGDIQVAALNVLNYFTTLNTGPGGCGPTGALDCRGANTAFELGRQRAKTVTEILGLDADILGLMEIQNDASVTVADLVGALNAATAPGTYASINTGTIGTDAIKLALIYRPDTVTPVGAHAILNSAVDPRFIDTLNRPSLAQTFDAVSGGRLTVVVNHLKSKGSACAGDPDIGDGQGNCSQTRTAAARALTDWIASDPTDSGDRDVLVMGDLNSYAKEDPIDVFLASGYTNMIEAFQGAEAYSFVFQGQTGYLDHALASPTLATQITGANEWHVNADEPPVLDYNTEFKSANHISSLYAPTAYRSSDHDPLLVGIDLLDYDFSGFLSPVANPPALNTVKAGQTIPVKFTLNGDLGLGVLSGTPTASAFTCTTGVPTGDVASAATAGGTGLTFNPANGIYTYAWKTEKAWALQCRSFSLTLDDGTYRTADFQFRN